MIPPLVSTPMLSRAVYLGALSVFYFAEASPTLTLGGFITILKNGSTTILDRFFLYLKIISL